MGVTSEEQLRLVLDNVGEAVFLLDTGAHVLTWNQAAASLFDYTSEQAIGLHVSCLYPSGVADESVRSALSEARETGRSESQGWRVTRTGTRLWASSVLSALRDANGELRGFAKCVRDETKLHEMQLLLAAQTAELERSNQDLQAFATVASHDLQAPLRKIRMFADRTRTRWPDAPAEAGTMLERIEHSAQRLQQLVDGLLAYASVARVPRGRGLVDLAGIVRDVRGDLEATVIEIGPLPTIVAEATQMRQLFQNLIANAIKFRKDKVPLALSISSERRGDRWSIRIADNGIGFEPKHARQIFEPLQRLHGQHEYEGTGLGLAICRRIVEAHGGTIVAEGRPGQGAVFTIGLPVSSTQPGGI
jgi:PAS domain S-box-containing protein